MKKIYAALILALIAVVSVFAFWPKSHKQKIESTISEHLNTRASVVSLRPVSVSAPDSIALVRAKKAFDFYSKSCVDLTKAGGDYKTHWLGDSLFASERAFYAASAKMPKPAHKTYPYTLCAYTAGPDTLHIILDELQEWAIENDDSLTRFEALQIAVSIQRNRVLSDAFVLGHGVPSALEAIAMELGAAKTGSTIKDAIYSLNGD